MAKRLECSEEIADDFIEYCNKTLNTYITSEDLEQRFRTGKNLTDDIMEALFTRKNSRKRLDPEGQAPTMVTLPDDFIHPYEDRILSVREMARFQSFDDSFEFLGKRTTGGEKRKVEVPQYTQVGNAVAPLVAKAVVRANGIALKKGRGIASYKCEGFNSREIVLVFIGSNTVSCRSSRGGKSHGNIKDEKTRELGLLSLSLHH